MSKNVKSETRKLKGDKPEPRKPEKSTKPEHDEDLQDGGKKKKRSFRLVDNPRYRYVGDTPKQAASKAYSKTILRMKKDGKKIPTTRSLDLFLRESTRGGTKKIYGYKATRVEYNILINNI